MSHRQTTRRSLLAGALSLAALPVLAQPSPDDLSDEDKAVVAKAAAYLDGLNELKGRFEQTDPRGRTTNGDLYLSRPGRARFAYDPPYGMVTVSDGRRVWVYDPRLKTVNHYPLSATPLSLFLAEHVRLDRGVSVTNVDHFSDGFALTAVDARHRSQGQITLVFADAPVRLREWSLTDGQGRTTRIRLTGLHATSGLDPALFAPPGGGGATAAQP
ncbi:LolA family protein [Phenylobacterium montanum]|uniref:Outer-membrane lipoprotein carrier protein LolA n=1 Tax=Phenylobacterium montanum TaxID=2823693 RepID=A0A975FWB7_9CAUL|nr:outer-membrane lipoprotein carrier protein LolA [Caulobacter sp. S6]QUD86668.1 outer-membrane lipoprotein carrier protein LolA [Caulobacter sp. S6]